MKSVLLILFGLFFLSACSEDEVGGAPDAEDELPDMRWSHVPQHEAWEDAAVLALTEHGAPLVEMVPADINTWCPAYTETDTLGRQAFWVGFMSALAKHESTYRPAAVSSNGKWFGLLQISPATARGYHCRAGSGSDLKVGGENLSCAIRIMTVTVPRDDVIYAHDDGRWRGVAADWGPLRVASKRQDIAAWLNQQPFCQKPT